MTLAKPNLFYTVSHKKEDTIHLFIRFLIKIADRHLIFFTNTFSL